MPPQLALRCRAATCAELPYEYTRAPRNRMGRSPPQAVAVRALEKLAGFPRQQKGVAVDPKIWKPAESPARANPPWHPGRGVSHEEPPTLLTVRDFASRLGRKQERHEAATWASYLTSADCAAVF
ncbi:hypothetical protein PHYPSEUDO_002761 [Phytophthora pseudosyringae]|uniref:Uncharacterized protein n=1 Tax=Phytophthora pseudosyringae TaxID=221518 RepID=A0A8T1VXN8_9STRA|nr:hypothetical protein PHYPSEUDO_002761 [Phytophthora pseudosyringae]